MESPNRKDIRRLSLTDFVEIVSKSGTPKATKVRQVKDRPSYHPSADYYKQIREAIVEIHRDNSTESILQNIATNTSPAKRENYTAICAGYKQWHKKHKLAWFQPPDCLYEHSGIHISVNPELGLFVEDKPHLIKLYFKAEPLTKNRVEIITHLMSNCLKTSSPLNTTMAILDIRSSKLIFSLPTETKLNALINAELVYIAALWDEV